MATLSSEEHNSWNALQGSKAPWRGRVGKNRYAKINSVWKNFGGNPKPEKKVSLGKPYC